MAKQAQALRRQFGLSWQAPPEPERVPAGIGGIALPRGCLTEIFGRASSGRTALLFSLLAAATMRGEICALVDADHTFDPASAAGIRLDRLLWIACGHNPEDALKAADLLVQGGGFGVVALDLGDVPPETARRISLTSWFRLRRAVEHTPTVLVAVARQSNAKTCASLQLECRRESGGSDQAATAGPGRPHPEWSGARPGRLFRGFRVRVIALERRTVCSPVFMAGAI